MKKANSIFLIFLCILLSFKITFQEKSYTVVPENEFIPLNSRQVVPIELNKTKNELYYSFQNEFEGSDIIINLKVAKGFTTYCYIYDSYDKITVNDKGEYINYLKEFVMSENSILLKSSDLSIKKIKYYIVIKDLINSYNKDYISIFNEQDYIQLENEKYLNIDRFYSKNKYSFTFSHTKEEVVSLELNTYNTQYSQYVSIYDQKSGELIYKGEKNKGEIKLNEERADEGTYMVEIESLEEPYTDIKLSIILHKYENFVKQLKYDSPLTLGYIGTKEFNFYVDIDDYDFHDENIITFKFGDQIFNRNLLSHCYAKVMNFEKNDDNKFLANMPAQEDENEAVFSILDGNTNIYQLYFKKTMEKEENKKSYLLIHLCLKLEEHDKEEYISPDEFTVYLSNKPEKINLVEYKNKNNILNKNIKLRQYVPEVYKIILPKIDENLARLSYIFYSSENIQFIYNNSMLVDRTGNGKSKMIHVLSNSDKGYDYTKVIYVKLYGFNNKEVNFRIESNEASIYYIHNEYRGIKSFKNKLTDCSKPFYYIGDYGFLVNKGYIYQDIFYGKINTYYKGKVNSDESILINEDQKYLVKNNLLSLETSIDIVELKCEFPGFYEVHLIDEVEERDINLYSKTYNYLPAKKSLKISPVLNPLQEDINVEISTPMGKEVEISDGVSTIKIGSNNKYYRIKYKNYSEVPSSYIVLSNEDTVISVTITNKDPFVILEKSAHIDYDSHIILKLPRNQKYESFNIVMTRIYHGYSYSLFKGNVDYAPKLDGVEVDYITIDRSNKINMTISNPYLRDANNMNDENDDNDVYYLLFSIDDPEMVQKEVFFTYNDIKEYEKINVGASKIITKENEKYALPSFENDNDINMVYQSCGNSLKEINIYNYYDRLQSIFNNKNSSSFEHNLIKNYNSLNLQLGISFKNSKADDSILNGAVIGITDQQITDDDINKYSNLKLNISQNENKVEWEALDGIDNYDIFVLDENNSYVPYLKNPCLLESIKNNELKNLNNNESYIRHYSTNNNYTKLEEKGKYIVTVSTNIKGKVPLVYIYDEVIYDSSLIPPEPEPEPEPGPDDDDKKDDDNGSGTIIFLAISIPLVIIVVLIVLIILSKKKTTFDLDNNNEPLTRETNES